MDIQQQTRVLQQFGIPPHSVMTVAPKKGKSRGLQLFAKASKKDRKRTGLPYQRYPHISPAIGRIPQRLTNIRSVKVVGQYYVVQLYHSPIDTTGRLNGNLHNRFRAVERSSGAIHSVSSRTKFAIKKGQEIEEERLKDINYTVGQQTSQHGRPAIMSRAVMNRYNLYKEPVISDKEPVLPVVVAKDPEEK